MYKLKLIDNKSTTLSTAGLVKEDAYFMRLFRQHPFSWLIAWLNKGFLLFLPIFIYLYLFLLIFTL